MDRNVGTVLGCAMALVLSPCTTMSARAAEASGLAELRAEMREMQRRYEERIAALEERVAEAEDTARDAALRATEAERTGAGPVAAPAAGGPTFNPDVSVILQGRAAAFGGPEGHRPIPGFPLGEETGVGPEGLSLGESEIDFSANIDDRFFGFLNFALNDEDGETEIELEEAYFQTLSLPEPLPGGMTVRGGKFFSSIGYQNRQHSHAWDFVDAPLAYEAFLGNQLLDTGVQVTWVAPTDLYLELGGELLRGDGFPGGGAADDGLGSFALFGKVSGEIGTSHTWQAGLSLLSADPEDRASEDAFGRELAFTGSTDLVIADFVWKWAPDGNWSERNFELQTEFFHGRERGSLFADDGPGRLDARRTGFYTQGVYQFMPRWRVGLRYGHVFADNDLGGLASELLPDESSGRLSAMIDFSNSEFSRLRLQLNHGFGGLADDDAIMLQYIMSIGSHGAHTF